MHENHDVKSRRHRPPRLTMLSSGVRPFYFVTFNTYKRVAILAQEAVHQAFIQFCGQAVGRGVSVGRYVIMPDHLHLFVVLPLEDLTLTRWVQSLKNYLGKTLLRCGKDKPHWQEGFFDHVLRSDERYAQKSECVRQNPVRAGLVERPEDWPYQGEIEAVRY